MGKSGEQRPNKTLCMRRAQRLAKHNAGFFPGNLEKGGQEKVIREYSCFVFFNKKAH